MNFEYTLESIRTDSLKLDYYLVPWDTEILGFPVSDIAHIEIHSPDKAYQDIKKFQVWCNDNRITLCSCRLDHCHLKESMFLEEQGFRFVELNYRPELNNLQDFNLAPQEFAIEEARDRDQERLIEVAGRIFQCERFHMDPRLGPSLGNKRYESWMRNALKHPGQQVLKCIHRNEMIGFFVVEYPTSDHCFWSLVGLTPEMQGKGMGKRAWRSMLCWHKKQGIKKVSTSITSHNIRVFNLYSSLGFKFPLPKATFHWILC